MLKDFNVETLEKLFADENNDTSSVDFAEIKEKLESFDAKQWSLFKFSGEDLEDVEEISNLDIDTDEIEFNGDSLLILTEDEADDRWEEELQYYFDEVVLPEIPECYQNYMDYKRWRHDARLDGRGHAISRYDGCENEFNIEFDDGSECWINIYRM